MTFDEFGDWEDVRPARQAEGTPMLPRRPQGQRVACPQSVPQAEQEAAGQETVEPFEELP